MKNLRSYFGGIAVFFAAEAIQYIAIFTISIICSVIIAFQAGFRSQTADVAEYENAFNNILTQSTLYYISVAAVLICGIVFSFWYRKLSRGEARGAIRLIFTAKNITLFIFLGIGCQLFMSGVMSLIQPFFQKTFYDYSNTVSELMSGNKIVVLLFMIGIAPVTEELVFRGVILQKTREAIPFIGANLTQAFLFGVYHGNIVQGIYAATIGFLLGLVCYKYRSIFASIFLHMIINASAFIAMLVPSNTLSYIIMVITGGAFIAISLRIMKPTNIVLSGEQKEDVTINHF